MAYAAASETAAAYANQADILMHLSQRHKEVDAELSALERLTDVSRRGEVLDKLVHDLAVHTAVEELVFYPAIQRELGGKDPRFSEEVLRLMEEHQEAKETLDELYSMGPEGERFASCVSELADGVRKHVKEEEAIFPELRAHWTPQRLHELLDDFVYAERHAPTRPHPSLPSKGRFGASVQFVAAALDKMKDAVRDSKTSTKGTTEL